MDRKRISLGAALAVASLSAAPAGAQVPAVPAISSCQVKTLDADSVLVTGTVNPALVSTVRVRYGLLGLLNLESLTLNASPTGAISTQLDGLVVGGDYGCRIAAVNELGIDIPGLVPGVVTNFLFPTGTSGSNGSDGSNGTGGSGATPYVDPVTGQVVPAGTPGAVKCTLTGTAGKDRLKGTKLADVICGLGGADRIRGLAGNDTLIGGTGNDMLKGNRGSDRIQGNKGKDRLMGGKGKDRLAGHAGADKFVGWKGRDRMAGGRGGDSFTAHRDRRGGDRVMGGKGRDRATLNRGDRARSIERPRTMS